MVSVGPHEITTSGFFEPLVGIFARAVVQESRSEPGIVDLGSRLVVVTDTGVRDVFTLVRDTMGVPFNLVFLAEEGIFDRGLVRWEIHLQVTLETLLL